MHWSYLFDKKAYNRVTYGLVDVGTGDMNIDMYLRYHPMLTLDWTGGMIV